MILRSVLRYLQYLTSGPKSDWVLMPINKLSYVLQDFKSVSVVVLHRKLKGATNLNTELLALFQSSLRGCDLWVPLD